MPNGCDWRLASAPHMCAEPKLKSPSGNDTPQRLRLAPRQWSCSLSRLTNEKEKKELSVAPLFDDSALLILLTATTSLLQRLPKTATVRYTFCLKLLNLAMVGKPPVPLVFRSCSSSGSVVSKNVGRLSVGAGVWLRLAPKCPAKRATVLGHTCIRSQPLHMMNGTPLGLPRSDLLRLAQSIPGRLWRLVALVLKKKFLGR